MLKIRKEKALTRLLSMSLMISLFVLASCVSSYMPNEKNIVTKNRNLISDKPIGKKLCLLHSLELQNMKRNDYQLYYKSLLNNLKKSNIFEEVITDTLQSHDYRLLQIVDKYNMKDKRKIVGAKMILELEISYYLMDNKGNVIFKTSSLTTNSKDFYGVNFGALTDLLEENFKANIEDFLTFLMGKKEML